LLVHYLLQCGGRGAVAATGIEVEKVQLHSL
jgi:hypothetical protein